MKNNKLSFTINVLNIQTNTLYMPDDKGKEELKSMFEMNKISHLLQLS